MDPYPGESFVVYDVLRANGDDKGASIVDVLWRRAGHGPMVDGDQWKAYYWPQYANSNRYLDEPTADLDVSWVVEVLSGSGTLTAATGVDPDYGDVDAATPTPLGSYPVSGAATIVIPSGMSAADVMNDDLDGVYVLSLTLTGSIDVQQVKVRAWPPTGPLGGWSELHDEWRDTPSLPSVMRAYEATDTTAEADADDPQEAWDIASDRLPAGGGPPSPPISVADVGGEVFWQLKAYANVALQSLSPLNYRADFFVENGMVLLEAPAWRTAFPIQPDLAQGVDWVRPPTEVEGDYDALVQRAGDGGAYWVNEGVAKEVTYGPAPFGGAMLYAASYGDLALVLNGDTVAGSPGFDLPGSIAFPDSKYNPDSTSLGDARYVLVMATAAAVLDPDRETPTWPGGPVGAFGGPGAWTETKIWLGTGSVDPVTQRIEHPLMAGAVVPAYRVWSPTAVPVVTAIPLRQYHRDDGLGVTPPRAYGGASRIRTGRAYGYD